MPCSCCHSWFRTPLCVSQRGERLSGLCHNTQLPIDDTQRIFWKSQVTRGRAGAVPLGDGAVEAASPSRAALFLCRTAGPAGLLRDSGDRLRCPPGTPRRPALAPTAGVRVPCLAFGCAVPRREGPSTGACWKMSTGRSVPTDDMIDHCIVQSMQLSLCFPPSKRTAFRCRLLIFSKQCKGHLGPRFS